MVGTIRSEFTAEEADTVVCEAATPKELDLKQPEETGLRLRGAISERGQVPSKGHKNFDQNQSESSQKIGSVGSGPKNAAGIPERLGR